MRTWFAVAAVCTAIVAGVGPAEAQVICTWTDNPLVAGETPIRAAHINEIRACIDRILAGGETLPPPPPPPGAAFTVSNVRQYNASISEAYWLYFDVTAHRAIPRLEIGIRFDHAAGTFTSCTEYLFNLEAGEIEEVLSIPDVCGADIPWVRVRISAPAGYTCTGCGTYGSANLPFDTEMSPRAVLSPEDTGKVIDEARQRP